MSMKNLNDLLWSQPGMQAFYFLKWFCRLILFYVQSFIGLKIYQGDKPLADATS
jgi:hypothetical protein